MSSGRETLRPSRGGIDGDARRKALTQKRECGRGRGRPRSRPLTCAESHGSMPNSHPAAGFAGMRVRRPHVRDVAAHGRITRAARHQVRGTGGARLAACSRARQAEGDASSLGKDGEREVAEAFDGRHAFRDEPVRGDFALCAAFEWGSRAASAVHVGALAVWCRISVPALGPSDVGSLRRQWRRPDVAVMPWWFRCPSPSRTRPE